MRRVTTVAGGPGWSLPGLRSALIRKMASWNAGCKRRDFTIGAMECEDTSKRPSLCKSPHVRSARVFAYFRPSDLWTEVKWLGSSAVTALDTEDAARGTMGPCKLDREILCLLSSPAVSPKP